MKQPGLLNVKFPHTCIPSGYTIRIGRTGDCHDRTSF